MRFTGAMGLPPSHDCFAQLQTAYSQPQRHYHNTGHINACLEQFEHVRSGAESPETIECAIWFHDVIYDPRANDNELRSADFATDFLISNGIEQTIVDRVHSLIMATRHEGSANDDDARILVDVDLSILGAPEADYDVYEKAIRQEYSHVPEALYRTGRTKVLAGFLDRERIYHSDYFGQRLEDRARLNLDRAISALR